MNKLQEVTEKICELLKGTELDPMELKEGNYIQGIKYVPIRIITITSNNHIKASWRDGSCTWFEPHQVKSVPAPIREAEMLMALSIGYKDELYPEIFMTANGEIGHSEEHWIDGGMIGNWQLGKPLQEQSKETIEFLHEILMK